MNFEDNAKAFHLNMETGEGLRRLLLTEFRFGGSLSDDTEPVHCFFR